MKRVSQSDIIIFTVFFVLTFIFWYLSALRKEIKADVKYPIEYHNTPSNFDSDEMLHRMELHLEGTGSSMMKLKKNGRENPIIIDFDKNAYYYIPNKETDGVETYYLLTSEMLVTVTEQLKATCKISYLKPDTLFFHTLVPELDEEQVDER